MEQRETSPVLNLQDDTYGTSPAAKTLVLLMCERGDKYAHRKVAGLLQRYQSGLNEFIKVNNPFRDHAMRWWKDKVLRENFTIEAEFERINIPITYLHNVMNRRLHQALDQGAVLEVLRERDPDHNFIIEELRLQRKLEDERE